MHIFVDLILSRAPHKCKKNIVDFERRKNMEAVKEMEITKSYLDYQDLMTILGCSKRKAYNVIAMLNSELERQGAFYIAGKVNKAYFFSRWNGNTK